MFEGSLVALVTPMRENGDVDWAALDGLIEWHLASGTHGIVPVGTTGEAATLNVDEHTAVIERTLKRVGGKVPVVAGTGANATAETIELTRHGKSVGADACLLVTPYYNRPTQEGLYQHYCAIANAVDIPIILYNVPPRTACDMQAETVARLSTVPQIVGIKEACGDAERVKEIRALVSDEFIVLSGEDAQTLTMMGYGAVGTISVTANVVPDLMSMFCEHYLKGETEQAQALDDRLQPIHAILFCESSPTPSKWALREMGKIDRGIRLPLVPLSEPHHENMRRELRKIGAL